VGLYQAHEWNLLTIVLYKSAILQKRLIETGIKPRIFCHFFANFILPIKNVNNLILKGLASDSLSGA
jgi:hypothetical protein